MDRRADDERLDWFFLIADEAWDMASLITSMIHNTTRSKPEDCKKPDQFNPTLESGQVSSDSNDAAFEFARKREAAKKNV